MSVFVQNCPRKLAVVHPNTESVFGQFRNSEISDSDWHLYSWHEFYHCQSSTGHRISGPSSSVEPRMNLALPTRARSGVYSRPFFLTCILALSYAIWCITDSRFYDSTSSFLVPPSDLKSCDQSFELHYTTAFILPGPRLPMYARNELAWPEFPGLWFPTLSEFSWPSLLRSPD